MAVLVINQQASPAAADYAAFIRSLARTMELAERLGLYASNAGDGPAIQTVLGISDEGNATRDRLVGISDLKSSAFIVSADDAAVAARARYIFTELSTRIA